MQIRITGRREGSVAIIEVSDTGPGVPAKAREHLFEAFQTSGRPGGSGLGLAIAAELVRAHGGDIHLVEGTIGATFRIVDSRPPGGTAERAQRAGAGVNPPRSAAILRPFCADLRQRKCDGQMPRSGPCQTRPEPVAKALFRDASEPLSDASGPLKPAYPRENAPVAQLDRAPDYESGGQEFEISSGAPFYDFARYCAISPPRTREHRQILAVSRMC